MSLYVLGLIFDTLKIQYHGIPKHLHLLRPTVFINIQFKIFEISGNSNSSSIILQCNIKNENGSITLLNIHYYCLSSSFFIAIWYMLCTEKYIPFLIFCSVSRFERINVFWFESMEHQVPLHTAPHSLISTN